MLEKRLVVVALPRVPVPRLKFVLNKLVLVAVPKYPIPLAVMFVVLAPPDIVKRPEVIVEDALERKQLPKVARPVCDSVPAIAADCADRTPIDADVEYKFVLLAVVANKLVLVADTADRLPICADEEKRLVELAVVLKRLVVVALVRVASVAEVLVAETELPEKELPVMVALEIATLLSWSILPVWAMTW